MSELKDVFTKMAKDESGELCPVGRILLSMDTETKEAFNQVMKSTASTRDIHSELAKSGYKIGRDTIGSHRSKWCKCEGYYNSDQK